MQGALFWPAVVAAAEETWALVVEKMAGSTTNDDTTKKVLKDVVPGLGIRVHSVNPTRAGGATAAKRQLKISWAKNNCSTCAQIHVT